MGFFGAKKNEGRYRSKVNGVQTKEYVHWKNMLNRCYNPKFQVAQPTYKGCSVSDNFKNFQYFAEWCNAQTGFAAGCQLDKDLLDRGNNVYSEDTCIFLPQELNKLLYRGGKSKGLYPVGVNFHKAANAYVAQISINSEAKYLGVYESVTEAFNVYKTNKENHIKSIACKYAHCLDPRAYTALLEWEVSITD